MAPTTAGIHAACIAIAVARVIAAALLALWCTPAPLAVRCTPAFGGRPGALPRALARAGRPLLVAMPARDSLRGLLGRDFGLLAPQDEKPPEMLDGRAVELGANALHQRLTGRPIVIEHTDLDELVRGERQVDFVQDLRCCAVVPDADDHVEMMGAGA